MTLSVNNEIFKYDDVSRAMCMMMVSAVMGWKVEIISTKE